MNFFRIGPAILRVGRKDILVGLASFTRVDEPPIYCTNNFWSTHVNLVWFREWIKNTIYGM